MNHSIYLLKQAWTGLSAKKGFLVTIVTTLGITLGALLCILTLAYVVISKPLPYPEQEKLYTVSSVIVDEKNETVGRGFSYPSLINLYENQTLFSESALVRYETGVVSSLPTQPMIDAIFITPGWFSLMGSDVAVGRYFEESEKKDSFNPVAVLSYEFWQDEYNSDPGILEKSVMVGSTSYKIVGVLAKSFVEPQLVGNGIKSDVFLPWDYNSNNTNTRVRESFGNWSSWSSFVGKLDSELSLSQVEQTLTTPFNSFWKENVTDRANFANWSFTLKLTSFKDTILGNSKNTVLLLLLGVIGLILIACTNITNLFMSRTADQQRELAIQAAVGASRSDIFKVLFAQSGLVVFISSLLALVVASVGFWILQQYLAERLPRVEELSINIVTLSAALLIALFLGVVFARISASMINYKALNTTLQSSGKGTGVQVSKSVRKLLIISQVTIVTLLVFVNIGLLKDSMKVINEPMGIETDNLTSMKLRLTTAGGLTAEEKIPLMLELKDALLDLPQVDNVSQSGSPIYNSRRIAQRLEANDQTSIVQTRFIDETYFDIIRQPLVEGDYFSAADIRDGNQVIIINDVYAEKIAEHGDVIGSRIWIVNAWRTVVGVVKSYKMPGQDNRPMRSYLPGSGEGLDFIVKLKPNQNLQREATVALVQNISREFYIRDLETMEERRTQLLFTQYTTAITSAVLAVLTFFLATIGLYGIISYATLMRRFELGTRLAIGAKRRDVVALIIKDNAGSVAVGIGLSVVIMMGLYLGFSDALVSYVSSQLIPMFAGTLLLIGMMALFACFWPLRPIINARPIHSLRGNQ